MPTTWQLAVGYTGTKRRDCTSSLSGIPLRNGQVTCAPSKAISGFAEEYIAPHWLVFLAGGVAGFGGKKGVTII